jgi:hypothetical protein
MAYGVDCTFQYGSWLSERRVSRGADWTAPCRLGVPLADGEESRTGESGSRSPRQRYFAAVAKRLNALDPHLHRMLYCYLRALRLRNEEFWEDSVTSLDATVRIAAELVRNRLGNVTENPMRR